MRDRVQHDIDRKLAAIRATTDRLEADTHRPQVQVRTVLGAVADVLLSQVLRQQHFDWGRHEGCRLMPEQSAGLTIGVPDDTLPIDHEDRIGQQLKCFGT